MKVLATLPVYTATVASIECRLVVGSPCEHDSRPRPLAAFPVLAQPVRNGTEHTIQEEDCTVYACTVGAGLSDMRDVLHKVTPTTKGAG